MAKTKESFFWTSYSDMMTSLFFIMLLLFLLSTGGMYLQKKHAEEERAATQKELDKINEIKQAANELPKAYFEPDQEKRWSLKQEYAPKFSIGDSNIRALNDTTELIHVGRSLMQVVETLNEKKNDPEYSKMDITYLVVIEGMASNDNYWDNDRLSYSRALSLYNLWKINGIDFENSQCEVHISGSGVRGRGRYNKDGNSPQDEYKNQRILIQIVPKIGEI